AEVLGYGRSLEADVRVRGGTAAVAPLYLAAARRAVARQLRGRQVDLVPAPAARRSGGAGAKPRMVIGLHGSDVFLAERRGARRLARWALGRARLLTGSSRELVERVCALGFPAARSRVIPYGVDTVRFSPDRGRGRPWRGRVGGRG